LFEIGPGQADAVLNLLAEGGLAVENGRSLWPDLGGRPRVVVARP